MTQAKRDRVTILADGSAKRSPQPDFTREVLRSVPATVTANSRGTEKLRGFQMEADVQYVVKINYSRGVRILANMRVRVDGGLLSGQTLDIVRVQPVEEPASPPQLLIGCKELEAGR